MLSISLAIHLHISATTSESTPYSVILFSGLISSSAVERRSAILWISAARTTAVTSSKVLLERRSLRESSSALPSAPPIRSVEVATRRRKCEKSGVSKLSSDWPFFQAPRPVTVCERTSVRRGEAMAVWIKASSVFGSVAEKSWRYIPTPNSLFSEKYPSSAMTPKSSVKERSRLLRRQQRRS